MNTNIAAAYDRWAESYDRDPNRTRDLAGEVLRQAGLRLDGRTVVEIGCGTGRNTLWLDEHAHTVLALDVSTGMLDQAMRRGLSARVRWLEHDVRREWPIADASADVVIALLVLEHVEMLEPIFSQARRVLRDGGELFVCELHPTRQMLGRRAEFVDPDTGERQRVTAFLHDVSEYVHAGLDAGFRLGSLREWRDAGARTTDPPRLLSLHMHIPAGTAPN